MEGKRGMGAQRSDVPCLKSPRQVNSMGRNVKMWVCLHPFLQLFEIQDYHDCYDPARGKVTLLLPLRHGALCVFLPSSSFSVLLA